jgi:hypothetical protein
MPLGYINPPSQGLYGSILFQPLDRPSPSLSQILEGISKINRRNSNLATPLDSPYSGTSDPCREFVDSRGKSSRY